MAKKDNEEIPFAASPSAGNSEKLKALQAAMDKIEKLLVKLYHEWVMTTYRKWK